MSTLAERLIEMAESLQPALGTTPEAVVALLHAEAASAIQQDPSEATLSADLPPLIAAAIRKGQEDANKLKALGVRSSLILRDLTDGTSFPQQPLEKFGPFVERSGRLLEFASVVSGKFLSVHFRLPSAPLPLETWLLLPLDSSASSADNRTWKLVAGTVWIRSRYLVHGAPGFTGLRIASGTLEFDRQVEMHSGRILAPNLAVWTLSVEPEPPAPADATGSDSEAETVILPAKLEVRSNAGAQISGPAEVSGFGSALRFSPAGAPSFDGQQIRFPLAAAEAKWTITKNRSRCAQFSGESSPASPRWTLPVSTAAENELGEARHGGSLEISLAGPLAAATPQEENGPANCFVNTLTVNAIGIDFLSLQPECKARYDLELWGKAATAVRLAGSPLKRVIFRSERGGFDSFTIFGGKCVNHWDMPRRADGKPFAFAGDAALFGFLSKANDLWTVCIAETTQSGEMTGIALENLYLTVRPPSRSFLLGSIDAAGQVPAGTALLFFDVNLAMPTLPDPYAANFGPPKSDIFRPKALRIALPWTNSETPVPIAHLDAPVIGPQHVIPLPVDSDEREMEAMFRRALQLNENSPVAAEALYLLDLSSNDHLFGVAFEPLPSQGKLQVVDNRFSVRLQNVRLLMQPQVQWEPVYVIPPDPGKGDLKHPLFKEYLYSTNNGGPTLVGAQAVTLLPALPGLVSREIVHAIRSSKNGAALFSLPFGLRAMANLKQPDFQIPAHKGPATDTELHEPSFTIGQSARQIRLTARNTKPGDDPSRVMPGRLKQLNNLSTNSPDGSSKLTSVIPPELTGPFDAQFGSAIPLHRADLSGYGLSTFSEWRSGEDETKVGFSKVHFDVLNGRTAYEVLQYRSILYECGARVVRTVILERGNSGTVTRFDTGWVAVEPGKFVLPPVPPTPPNLPVRGETGAVKSLQNIRNIRIVGELIAVGLNQAVQPVLFDGDAEIDGVVGGGPGRLVPFQDRSGYVQIAQAPAGGEAAAGAPPLSPAEVRNMFTKVGPVSGPINCVLRAGKTLEMQLASIVSDSALNDAGDWGFAVAVLGTPRLPHAGHWSVVRIDPGTSEVSPIDAHRGAPIVRNGGNPYQFREPSDARVTAAKINHGFLMSTDTSRVLFPQPKLDPAQPGRILFDQNASVAEPYSMVQSGAVFPLQKAAIQLDKPAAFQVTPDNAWKIDSSSFHRTGIPDKQLLTGSEWGINRNYVETPIDLGIDSAAAKPFSVGVSPCAAR